MWKLHITMEEIKQKMETSLNGNVQFHNSEIQKKLAFDKRWIQYNHIHVFLAIGVKLEKLSMQCAVTGKSWMFSN